MPCMHVKYWAPAVALLLVIMLAGVVGFSPGVQAKDAQLCSTVPQASDVIDRSSSRRGLIMDVAMSVPSDPSSCIPSYCQASLDKPEAVRISIGAGLAEAYAKALANNEDEIARRITDMACSISCDEVVAQSFAAGRGKSLEKICGSSYEGAGGTAPGLMEINADGGGGSASTSGN